MTQQVVEGKQGVCKHCGEEILYHVGTNRWYHRTTGHRECVAVTVAEPLEVEDETGVSMSERTVSHGDYFDHPQAQSDKCSMCHPELGRKETAEPERLLKDPVRVSSKITPKHDSHLVCGNGHEIDAEHLEAFKRAINAKPSRREAAMSTELERARRELETRLMWPYTFKSKLVADFERLVRAETVEACAQARHAQIEVLRKFAENHNAELAALQAENQRLREALVWFGNRTRQFKHYWRQLQAWKRIGASHAEGELVARDYEEYNKMGAILELAEAALAEKGSKSCTESSDLKKKEGKS